MLFADTDLVMVQLTLPEKTHLLPRALRPFELRREQPGESQERRSRNASGNGVLVCSSREPTDTSQIVRHLERVGFVLVGAHLQRRLDKHPKGKPYISLRFTFARGLRDDANPEFLQARGNLRKALIGLTCKSFWGVRIYDNPLFLNGEPVKGRRSCVIDLGSRRDREERVWRRDEHGEKVGKEPQLLAPTFYLAKRDGGLQLVPSDRFEQESAHTQVAEARRE